jgi:hypothetical protein
VRKTIMAVVAAGAVLSGCSGSAEEKAEPEVVQAKEGQCVAKEVDDGIDPAPDFTTVVPCTEPHVYGVVGVVPIPEKYLEGTTDKEKLAQRAVLAKPGEVEPGSTRAEMMKDVFPTCEPKFSAQLGFDDLSVRDKSAAEAGLRPYFGAGYWYNVTSKEQWLDGQTAVLCTIRLYDLPKGEEEASLLPTAGPDDAPLLTHYFDESFPLDLRRCIDADSRKLFAPCDGPHWDEMLYSIDMRAVYGKNFVRGQDLTNVDEASFAKIKRACTDPYAQAGLTLPAGREMSFRFPDEQDEDYLILSCALRPADGKSVDEYAAFS